MRSDAPTVARYVDEQPSDWKPTLKRLRASCRPELKGYVETMAYGMPSYLRDDRTEVAFAKQARYLSFYILNAAVFEAHRAELAGMSLGKGCIRYRRPDQVDWALVATLLSETRARRDEIC